MNAFNTALIAGVSAICLSTSTIAQDAPNADTVLAKVNDTNITLGHVASMIEGLPAQYDNIPAADLLGNVLDQMIQQTLLAQATDVSKKRLQLLTENNNRAVIANEYLTDLIDSTLSDASLQDAYQDYTANNPPNPSFRASHILVETEQEAKDVIAMLQDGQDFAEVAREKSTGPSGPNGGDLGWFGLGQMVPDFENAVVELNVDAVSEPVQTQFGWHVIKLFDKRDHPPIEDLAQVLTEQMQANIVNDEIKRLEAAADLQITELDFDPELIRDKALLD